EKIALPPEYPLWDGTISGESGPSTASGEPHSVDWCSYRCDLFYCPFSRPEAWCLEICCSQCSLGADYGTCPAASPLRAAGGSNWPHHLGVYIFLSHLRAARHWDRSAYLVPRGRLPFCSLRRHRSSLSDLGRWRLCCTADHCGAHLCALDNWFAVRIG